MATSVREYISRGWKFGFVGLSGFFVNQGVLMFLVGFANFPVWFSGIIAIELSIITNWVLNDIWTWRDKRSGKWTTRFLKYNAVAALTAFGVNYAVLLFLTHLIGLNYAISNIIGIVLAAGANFLVNHHWTYRSPEKELPKNKLKKRKYIKIFTVMVLFLLAFVIFIISAFFLITPVQRWVIKRAIAIKGIPVHVDYDRMKIGFDRLCVDNLLVFYRLDNVDILVKADSIRSEFVLLERYVNRLEVYRPRVDVDEREKSLPDKKKEQKPENRSSQSKPFNISVENLVISDGHFNILGFDIEDFSFLGSLVSENDIHVLSPDSMGVFLPGRGRANKISGEIVYGDSLGMDVILDAQRSKLEVVGELFGFSPINWHFMAQGEQVDLVEIDSILGLDVLQGKGRVKIDLSGKEDSVSGYAFIDGEVFDIPTDAASCNLLFRNNRLLLENLKGGAWGSEIDARLEMYFPEGDDPTILKIQGQAQNLDLNSFMDDDQLSSNLSGIVDIDGKLFDNDVSLLIKGILSEGSILNIPFSNAAGSLYVDSDSVYFYEGFEVQKLHDIIRLTGIIETDGEIYIDAGLWSQDLSELTGLLNMDEIVGGRGWMLIEILSNNGQLIVSGEINSDSLVSSVLQHDDFMAEFTLYDIIEQPRGIIYINSQGSIFDTEYDSLRATLDLHGQRIYIKPFRIWSKNYTGSAICEVLLQAYETRIKTEGLELRSYNKTLNLDSALTVSIIGDSIISSPVYLGLLDGSARIDALESDGSEIDINAQLKNLNLKDLDDIMPLPNIEGKLEGKIQAKIELETGKFNGETDLEIHDFSSNGLNWDKAYIKSNFKQGKVFISPLSLERRTEKYSINGWIDPFKKNTEMSLEFKGEGQRLDIITSGLAEIDSAVGPFRINAKLDGNVDELNIQGDFKWENGAIGVRGLADPIEDLRVKLLLSENNLFIDSLSGKIGAKPMQRKSIWNRVKNIFRKEVEDYGRFAAAGSLNIFQLPDSMIDLAFSANNLPLNFPEMGIFLRGDADLALENDRGLKLNGKIDLKNANIIKLETGGNSGQSEIPIELNVELNMPRNIWILTDQLDAEISGDMNVLTQDDQLALYGELRVIHGKAFLYSQSFTIEEGVINFNSIDRINPELNIKAVTKSGGVRIVARITGDLETPQIALFAEDENGNRLAYSQQEIISLIALNTTLAPGDSFQVMDIIEERLPQVAQNYITRGVENVARNTLGVETFEFETSDEDVLDFSQANVTIGKYLTDRLFIRYTTSLGFDENTSDIVDLEYRLSEHFSIEARRSNTVETGESYRLDLKFRWEY